jgi:hypothetical protein
VPGNYDVARRVSPKQVKDGSGSAGQERAGDGQQHAEYRAEASVADYTA